MFGLLSPSHRPPTLGWAVEYVDRDGPVDLILFIDDDGKQGALLTCQVNHGEGVQVVRKSLEWEWWIEGRSQDDKSLRLIAGASVERVEWKSSENLCNTFISTERPAASRRFITVSP